jgi:predicted lipoprotein
MTSRQPRWFTGLGLLALLALPASAGCRSTEQNGPPPSADAALPAVGDGGGPALTRGAVLEALGQCALSTARDFLTAALALDIAVKDLAARPEVREPARAAFRKAMDAWQLLEAMQFGPAARKAVPGGAGMRDFIYAWPSSHRCGVEDALVSNGFRAPDFLATALVNRRGLGALEYLLFYEGTAGGCPASAALAALPAEERDARKRAYAAVLAPDVATRAAELVKAWDPAQGNFLATLSGAGPGNAVYPTTQHAFNAVADGLFYVEREVKDLKLAQPLGLRDCMNPTCPELLEFQFAGLSKASVRANLAGFRRLTEGCAADFSGIAFDDLLEALGAGAVAATLRERVAAANARLDAIEEPDLEQALAADVPSVKAVYDALKGVTDILKTQFRDVLNLELPMGIASDTD